MKKILATAIIFGVFPLTAHASTSAARIISNDDKISAIEKEIANLEEKQKQLLELKKSFEEKKIDINSLNSKGERPKIGLILSGGGSKGAAHIGVLKVIDKYQIPIDYIVGTSAGSIIGAMYSIGYHPDEIERFIGSLNFQELFINTVERKLENIMEKANERNYPISFSVDNEMKITLPSGIFDGQQIYLQLKDVFSRAEGIVDFDSLPIPFRAHTTDLGTGSPVVIDSGDLALATLKSMAIPTILDPIRGGEDFFVDGGVTENFPVITAYNMGADIVIGVDITAEKEGITDNSNIFDVLDHLSTYQSERRTEFQRKMPDILITPDVKSHGSLDFDDLGKLIEKGEEAAEEVESTLKQLSEPKRYSEIRNLGEKLEPYVTNIQQVKVSGSKLLTSDDVMRIKPDKEYLTREELNDWIGKIYALKYIDRVFYHVNGNSMKLVVREKVSKKLNANISYASVYGAALEISAEVPMVENFNLSERDFQLKAELSRYPKISLKGLSQRDFLKNTFYMSGELNYLVNPLFLYSGKRNASIYTTDEFGVSFSLGRAFYDRVILAYSLGYKNIKTNYESGIELDPYVKLKNSESVLTNYLSLYYDTANREYHFTDGLKLTGQVFSGNPYGKDEMYNGYLTKGEIAFPMTKKFSVITDFSRGEIYSQTYTPISELFSIGGLRSNFKRNRYSFIGLPYASIYADELRMAGITGQYNFSNNMYLYGKYNAVDISYESKYSTPAEKIRESYYGYGVGFGWDTILGPLDIVISNNAIGKGYLFQVHLGYSF